MEDYFLFGNIESDEEDQISEKEDDKIKELLLKKEIEAYVPVGNQPGWFNLAPNESIEIRFKNNSLGPTQIKYQLELLYFKKDYESCINLALKFIKAVENTKMNNTKEIIEILILCYIKLNKYELALDYVLEWKEANDLGQIFLKAKVYYLNHKIKESLNQLLIYDKIRPQNYLTYKLIAQNLLLISNNNLIINENFNLSLEVNAFFKLTFFRFQLSEWKLEMKYINERYLKEEKELKELIILSQGKKCILNELDLEVLEWLKELEAKGLALE